MGLGGGGSGPARRGGRACGGAGQPAGRPPGGAAAGRTGPAGHPRVVHHLPRHRRLRLQRARPCRVARARRRDGGEGRRSSRTATGRCSSTGSSPSSAPTPRRSPESTSWSPSTTRSSPTRRPPAAISAPPAPSAIRSTASRPARFDESRWRATVTDMRAKGAPVAEENVGPPSSIICPGRAGRSEAARPADSVHPIRPCVRNGAVQPAEQSHGEARAAPGSASAQRGQMVKPDTARGTGRSGRRRGNSATPGLARTGALPAEPCRGAVPRAVGAGRGGACRRCQDSDRYGRSNCRARFCGWRARHVARRLTVTVQLRGEVR